MSKTRLILTGGTSRMIAATKLHKRSREDGAARLVASCETTTLAVKVSPASANKPTITRHKSDWGDSAKADRRGRDIAAARAEARREAQPSKPIQPLFR
jgi:hypothetical protein